MRDRTHGYVVNVTVLGALQPFPYAELIRLCVVARYTGISCEVYWNFSEFLPVTIGNCYPTSITDVTKPSYFISRVHQPSEIELICETRKSNSFSGEPSCASVDSSAVSTVPLAKTGQGEHNVPAAYYWF